MGIEWQRIGPTSSEKVGQFRTLVRKNFILPDGTAREFVTKEKEQSHAQAVVAITPDGHVILARQFRPGPERVMYELPGGGAEAGETPQEAAIRELEEETGYCAGRVEYLGDIYKDAYTNTRWSYFIAYDCVPTEDGQQLDATEFIEPVLVTIPELMEIAHQAQMTDTEALFLAYESLQKIERGKNNETTN